MTNTTLSEHSQATALVYERRQKDKNRIDADQPGSSLRSGGDTRGTQSTSLNAGFKLTVFGKVDSENADKQRCLVIGDATMQNALLCKTLSCELGAVWDWVSEDTGLAKILDAPVQLIDIESLGLDVAIDFVERASECQSSASVAFINLTQRQDAKLAECYYGWPALQGVFRRDCEPQMLFNGIRCILDGKIWLPRRYLESFVKRHRTPLQQIKSGKSSELTRKEEQVLLVLSKGHTNNDIADELNISPHTVKTHVYNLYKKINVDNRLEAVLWGRQNMQTITRSI